MSRPFGVAMLFAGVDQNGPQLFHLDPSGTFIHCLAKSIGAASDGAEQNLKEHYHAVSPILDLTLVTFFFLEPDSPRGPEDRAFHSQTGHGGEID
jgi:20S proteasome alpha/beta subunit